MREVTRVAPPSAEHTHTFRFGFRVGFSLVVFDLALLLGVVIGCSVFIVRLVVFDLFRLGFSSGFSLA